MAEGFLTRDGVDWNELWYGGILPATQMYNEDLVDFESMWTSPIDEGYIKLFHRGDNSYERISDLSVPTNVAVVKGRIRPEPDIWGIGTGFTWRALVENTVEEVMEINSQLQFEDRDFMRKQVLAVLLQAPGTSTTKWGLWDGNFKSEEGITTPPDFGVHTFTAAHTHYYTTGNPVASGILLEDLSVAKKHIREHGHFGSLTTIMSDLQVQQLEQIALPIWDAGQGLGGAPVGNARPLNLNKFENSLSNEVIREGFRGRLVGMDILETAYMPDNYFVVTENTKGMFKQEKENPSVKGLILLPGEVGAYPIQNSKQFRWHKFGVRMRSFAVAVEISADATYTTPTVYGTGNVDTDY